MTDVSVKYEAEEGKLLECRYSYRATPATFNDPADYDASEPTYFYNGVETSFNDLPEGEDDLKGIAIEMNDYTAARDRRFSYSETEPSRHAHYD